MIDPSFNLFRFKNTIGTIHVCTHEELDQTYIDHVNERSEKLLFICHQWLLPVPFQ